MSDIDMCGNDNCKKAQNCLRFLAKSSKNQSYLYGIEEMCNEDNNYEYFLEVKRLNKAI